MSLKQIARENLYIKPMGYDRAKEIVSELKIVNSGDKEARTKSIELVVAYGVNPMLAQKMMGIKPQTALYPRIRDLCEQLVGAETDFRPSPVLNERQFDFYCDVSEYDGWDIDEKIRGAAMLHLVYGEDNFDSIKRFFDVDSGKLSRFCKTIMDQKHSGL